jgi:L-threonylcarbamoyladenylate synthase
MMDEIVKETARIIHKGGIVLYPTDTIWGIGCAATNFPAVQRIYQIKQRPDQKSMLVLTNGLSMLQEYLDEIPAAAIQIIQSVKRPTTIIYPGARNLASNLLAPDGSIGIRITSDPFCKKLITLTGTPLVSTSANVSGDESPSTFREITSYIKEQVDYVVNWRQEEQSPAVPSTVLKLDHRGVVTVLRS